VHTYFRLAALIDADWKCVFPYAGLEIRQIWMWWKRITVSCGEKRMRRIWHGNVCLSLFLLYFNLDRCSKICLWQIFWTVYREQELAKKYYDKLFKEYCIADLSRYKENKVSLFFFDPVKPDVWHTSQKSLHYCNILYHIWFTRLI